MGEREDGLFFFRCVPQARALALCGGRSMELWHKRLGHPSKKVLRKVPNVSVSSSFNKNGCDVCYRVKQPRKSFPISSSRASRIFELVHCDLWGSHRTRSSCGAYYFLTIVDDYSRAVWVYLLFNKLEVEFSFMNFVALVERQFDQKIKRVLSDNGTEFKCLNNYFVKNGVIFETSCVGTLQQNGRVERKHEHILSVARALRFQGHLPMKFWGECVMAACYLINRTPSSVLDFKTPYECLFGKEPNLSAIRVMGCLCYAHNQKSKGEKFDSRSRRCIFLGYPFAKKGWLLYDLEKRELLVSCDVDFYEHVFPLAESNVDHDSRLVVGTEELCCDDFDDVVDNGNNMNIGGVEFDAPAGNSEEVQTTEEGEIRVQQAEEGEVGVVLGEGVVLGSEQIVEGEVVQANASSAEEEMGKGKRVKFPNSRYRGFVTHMVVKKKNPSKQSLSPSATSGTPYPISHFVSYERFSNNYKKYIAAVSAGKTPKTFREAVKHEGWRKAMAEEIRELEDQGTWVLQELPPRKKALGSQWIYTEKRDEDEKLERLKARLVKFENH